MSEENTNKRDGFFETRRMLRILREQAGNASWFTIRHAEVALLIWDMRSDDGLEVQGIPSLLGLDQSTVNRILHTMADKRRNTNGLGWIEVRTDEQDRRYRRVFITDLGQWVFRHLLGAGTDKDSGAELARVTENHFLTANNIVMKAEVGNVEIKINNNTVNAEVIKGMDANELLAMESDGKIVRVMHEGKDRWWAYDVDDVNYSKPLYVQKDTPKKHIQMMAEGLIKITERYDARDASKAEWDLEKQLKIGMGTLNKDEFHRLRSMVMRGISKLADEKRAIAEEAHELAEAQKAKAAQRIHEAATAERKDIREHADAEGRELINNWARTESLSGERHREADALNMVLAQMMKMQEKMDAQAADNAELRKIVANELAAQRKTADDMLNEDDD